MFRSYRFYILLCIVAWQPCNPLLGAVIDATWDLGADGNWNTAANWDIAQIPNNNATDTFRVFIDDDPGNDVVITLNATLDIDRLTIDAGDELLLANSFDLDIADGALHVDGVIRFNSAGAGTDLTFSGPTNTLSGTGTLLLTGNSLNRIFGAPTGTLTIGSDITIEGGGSLGNNSLEFISSGLVDANIAATSLVVDPGAGGFTNNGTMQASSTGTLRLQGGTFTNTNGTIQALDGSVVEINIGAEIIGGDLHTEGSGAIQFIANTASIEDITITNGSLVRINNSIDPVVRGSITNNGTLEQNSFGAGTDVTLDGDVLLTGTGTWNMSNNLLNRFLGTTGAEVLTNDAGHTIQGSGSIGVNLMGLVNDGTITANQATRIEIDPSTVGVTNNSVLEARDGGTLQLQGGTFTNTNGVIQALDGSVVEVTTSAEIIGGELHTEGSGVIEFTANTASVEDTTITNGSLVRINNSIDPVIRGTITNNGTMEQNSLGAGTDVTLDADVLLTGSGTWNMSNNILNRFLGTTGAEILTNDTGHTIQGSGSIGANAMGLVNDGTIRANQATRIEIDPSTAGVVNNAVLEASGGGTLRLQGGTFTNTGGVIQALDGSVVEIAGGAEISGGDLHTEGGGAIRVTGNSTLADFTLTASSLLQINSSFDPVVRGTITNNGTIEQNSTGAGTDVTLDGDVTFTGSGTWKMANNSLNRFFGADDTDVLTNGPNHTIEGAGTFGGNSMGLVNQGTITANQTADLVIHTTSNIQNTGLMQAVGTGNVLEIQTSVLNEATGVIRATDGGTVEVSGAEINEGLIEATNNGLLLTSDSSFGHIGGGTVAVRSTGRFEVDGNYGQTDGITLGAGTIHADEMFFNGGILAPGDSIGSMEIVTGRLQVGSDATLAVEIGGLTPGTEHDQIVVTSPSTTLEFGADVAVTLANGFVPSLGDEFVLIDGGIAGRIVSQCEGGCVQIPIDNVPVGHTAGWFVVHRLSADGIIHSLVLIAADLSLYADADFDIDGDVDGHDLSIWQSGYGVASRAQRSYGDADLDGDVDGRDFLTWQRQYTGSLPLAANVSIPEPPSALLIVGSMLLATYKRRLR